MTGDAEGPRALVAFVPKLPAQPDTLDAQLESVTKRALAKAQDILGRPFDPDNGALARAQTAVIASALTTQVRVDGSKLRMRETDVLGKLLEIIKQEAAKLPPLPPIELPQREHRVLLDRSTDAEK